MIGNHQSTPHVTANHCLAKLEIIEIFRDADVRFDVGVGNPLRPLGQRDGQFAEFVLDFRDVGAEVVGQHRKCLTLDRKTFLCNELLQPRCDFVIARPHRLQDGTVGRTPLIESRPFVDVLLLVADDEHGRRRGLLHVERQFVDRPQLLRFFEHDELPRPIIGN